MARAYATAEGSLDAGPRGTSGSEIDLDPDDRNGLSEPSAAQCQHLRTISIKRLSERLGNVGPTSLALIRETIADLVDL